MLIGPGWVCLSIGSQTGGEKSMEMVSGRCWKHWSTEKSWCIGINPGEGNEPFPEELPALVQDCIARQAALLLKIKPENEEPVDLDVLVIRTMDAPLGVPYRMVFEFVERGSHLARLSEGLSVAEIYGDDHPEAHQEEGQYEENQPN